MDYSSLPRSQAMIKPPRADNVLSPLDHSRAIDAHERRADIASSISNQRNKLATCAAMPAFGSHSQQPSLSALQVLLIAVNACCAVRLIAWLHSAPANPRAIRLLCDTAGLSIPPFQLVETAVGDALSSTGRYSCQKQQEDVASHTANEEN
ncbi:hypothetical protein M3J09_006962 [Ascochyta lentis]